MAKSVLTADKPPVFESTRVPHGPVVPRFAHEHVDFCWRVIQRFDGYINATNTKAAIVLTFNSLTFATVVLKWGELSQNFGYSKVALGVAAILFVVCAVASVASLWFGLNAIIPMLSSPKEPGKYHSLVFFGHVAEFVTPDAYADAVRAGTMDSAVEDLAKQAHALGRIAALKFSQLTWAARLIVFVQLPAFLLMILVAVGPAILNAVSGGQP